MKYKRALKPEEFSFLEKEAEQLQKSLKSRKKKFLIWTLLIFIVGTAVLLNIDFQKPVTLVLVGGTVLILLITLLWAHLKEMKELRHRSESVAFLKAKGELTVMKVESERYYELVDSEDDGAFYLFELPGNQLFSFGGPGFYSGEKFPSTSFEIVRGPGINNETIFLEINNSGSRLEPVKRISGEEKRKMLSSQHYPDPKYFTVIDGTLEELENQLLQ